MSNIDKQALRSKSRAASAGEWIKESGDGWEAICSSDDHANGNFIIAHFEGPDAKANREFAQAANPATVLALLDELEAAEHTAAVDHEAACSLVEENEELKRRIAELEARSVTHDVGVMNIGNQYCEDFLVAWTVSGKSLHPGIYYLDARHAGDIPAGIGKQLS